MDTIEKYQSIREAGKILNTKMFKQVSKDQFFQAGAILNITEKNEVVLEEDNEFQTLMDFVLNERLFNKTSLIEDFFIAKKWGSEIERTFLKACSDAYTSLFKISNVSLENSKVTVEDILVNTGVQIDLTDINFSRTTRPGQLLLTRLVPCGEFNMTSGMSFSFPEGFEKYLLRRYKKEQKHIIHDNQSVKRFAAFFHLNRTDGNMILFE